MELDNSVKRRTLKKVLFQPNLKKIINYLLRTPGSWKVIFELGLEKFGIGFYTRRLAIYAQFEQTPSDQNSVRFSNTFKDELGRCVPNVDAPNGLFSAECYKNLKKILSKEILGGTIDFLRYEDLVPITGAHFSGSLPMGVDKDSIVDLNFNVKNFSDEYV